MQVRRVGGGLWLADGPATPGALIDLHAHTRHKSLDSGLAPPVLAERTKARGLSAVCITEHNSIWTAAEAAAVAEAHEIPVLRGMEVSTDEGHVLVFGVERYTLEMWRLERLHAICEAEGGVMVLAHPTRDAEFGRWWREAPSLFVAVEGANGDDSPRARALALEMASALGLPATGGSDAHSAPAVGRCATLFDRPIATERDVIAALRRGHLWPVEVTADGCARIVGAHKRPDEARRSTP